ncbi:MULTISPECIES: 30S ribosomal protein S20 [Brochothrix]|uniref:Small ribosomal subunit protein bS20 n=2 Tax=Brochothrix TaxID=2755 RepID=A0A1D2LFN6_BROTH|nr:MULTISPECIES: 30S ribosomal protein S20 [Brochothrix]SLM89995.1 SSU ribosomal protein S20p [Brachybacterium faecium]ANZ94421.1 30S ribosomal protein S20 [Brochothrix thermosphacta]ANZ97275.1 30S ribosomal protein S20 [Brochothrix thermosphacta]ATF26713.1 30S ribosomal protein S20 [Brochothrix thermosphacta]ATH86068.1 30S ribosomal protein S20 [Brochothrix thermosphacta]
MPNIKSAIKRVKQTETRNELKSSQRAAVRSAVRKFDAAVVANADNTSELYSQAVSKLDGAVSKGLIHKNKADRSKSRLAKKLAK